MRPHYLQALFAPESVAMFGASDTPDSVGQVVFKNLLEGGFAGDIYAINPKRDEVQGQKAYPDLDSLGETSTSPSWPLRRRPSPGSSSNVVPTASSR